MRAVLIALCATALLSACSGRMEGRRALNSSPSASALADGYVWARNDGRRMAGDPALLRQGQADQAACTESATMAGSLNMPAFVSCMEARGYSRRRV